MKKFISNSLTGQLVLLLFGTLFIAQALNLFFLVGERKTIAQASHYEEVIENLVELASPIPEFSRDEIPFVIAERYKSLGTVFISTHNRAERLEKAHPRPEYARRLQQKLSDAGAAPLQTTAAIRNIKSKPKSGPKSRPKSRPEFKKGSSRPDRKARPPEPGLYHPAAPPRPVSGKAPGRQEIVFSVEIEPGIWLNSLSPFYSKDALTWRALATTAFTMMLAGLGGIFLARRISMPIRKLAAAAEALGRGDDSRHIPETGSRDIRAAAAAFNTMQTRLTRNLEYHRATLRAIGHDLRTPLTSLRIRAEDIPNQADRRDFVRRIDDLTDMANAILGWAKDSAAVEKIAPVDLSSLLDSIVQDYVDQGQDVEFESSDVQIIVPCRRVALRRAIVNLVDNALKYGKCATLCMELQSKIVLIRVQDEGPGIPKDQLEKVLSPFTRLETSRNRDTGGMGLGLSIAQSVAQNHGGNLRLSNGPEGGLCAALSLPLSLLPEDSLLLHNETK